MKRVLVLSDLQVPFHDRPLVDKMLAFAQEWRPDEIYCVGDECDCEEVGRWVRGYSGEYAGTFGRALSETRALMGAFAELAPVHVMRSNHTARLERYIGRYAPALSSVAGLTYPELVGYTGNPRVTFHAGPWRFAPDWYLMHGDECGTSQVSGQSVRKACDALGASVVQGHSHRAGVFMHSAAANGRVVRSRTGVEVGHLMDQRKASYLLGGIGNWQQAFGLLTIDGATVTPTLVPVHRGRFVVEGRQL